MISVIIPTLNEGQHLATVLERLFSPCNIEFLVEVIIVDSGSEDETISVARRFPARIIYTTKRQRSLQFNLGASEAKGKVLFFLHADSLPPKDFAKSITDHFKKGFTAGCFRLTFDHTNWFLKANAWFTRFNISWVRFGDQGLFVAKDLFREAGGYRKDMMLLEDQDMAGRLKRRGKFKVIPMQIQTSARKYLVNGIVKTQTKFYLIWILYKLGFSQALLIKLYRNLK